MSTLPPRRRAVCACGKTLCYLLACGPDAEGATQIDCGRCQYLVWRLYKARGEALPKRAVMVVHTIGHAAGAVVESAVLVLETAGDDGRQVMRQRPRADLGAAIQGDALPLA